MEACDGDVQWRACVRPFDSVLVFRCWKLEYCCESRWNPSLWTQCSVFLLVPLLFWQKSVFRTKTFPLFSTWGSRSWPRHLRSSASSSCRRDASLCQSLVFFLKPTHQSFDSAKCRCLEPESENSCTRGTNWNSKTYEDGIEPTGLYDRSLSNRDSLSDILSAVVVSIKDTQKNPRNWWKQKHVKY